MHWVGRPKVISRRLISQRGGVGCKAGENLMLKAETGNSDGGGVQTVVVTKLEGAKHYRVYDIEARKGKGMESILFLNLSMGNMIETGEITGRVGCLLATRRCVWGLTL